MSDLRVVVVGAEAPFAFRLRDVIAAQLAGASCECVDPSLMRTRPDAAAVVIDARNDADGGGALPRRLRAMGFAGAVVVVGNAGGAGGAGGANPDGPARDGYAMVAPDRVADELMARLAEQMALAESPGAEQVMRARRLVAAGEVAKKLQHTLNNALMGLLAEAQLMQLDELSEEHAAALERMVALCRRMIELSRTLDGLADRKQTS